MNARQQFRGRVFRDPAYFVAAGFGSGLLPWAPGTWGSVVGAVMYWFLLRGLILPVYVLVVAACFLLGVFVSERVTRQLGVEDHQGIVWDEVAGVWITLAFVHPHVGWYQLAGAFVLFRAFDILKPWPIRAVEKTVHGGLGVMLDDALAGVYAGTVLFMVNALAFT